MTTTQTGTFGFMTAETKPSLWRNGAVLMVRDPHGNLSKSQGVNLENHTLPVADARRMPVGQRPSCDKNGFELCAAPLTSEAIDFLDHAQVVGAYYPQCAALVEAIVGAKAYAFDHNVRSATGQQERRQIKGGQAVQGPAHVVHGDYTLRSAVDRVRQLARPPEGNDTLCGYLRKGESLISAAAAEGALANGGRFAIVNVWRNIDEHPVATHPLALCDSQTVAPEDLVVFEIHYPNRIGENYWARYSPRHRMYYYPEMSRDEALLIKQWDSAGPLARSNGAKGDADVADAPCTFSFHSAFHPPDTRSDARDRWSIEVRCIVIYA
jgi:hypothetical protein